MSESDQTDRVPTEVQSHSNPQAPQASEIVVDDAAALPTYANFCRVTATPEEILLDFGLNQQPFGPGRQNVTANQRVVMNLFTAKRLFSAMGHTIHMYENAFGTIEPDVSRRAIMSQPRISDGDMAAPAATPDVIRIR